MHIALRYFLLIIPVFIGVSTTAQQQNRVTLLRGITDVPLPDTPNHICATFIFSHKPEIITTASDGRGSFQYNNIVTTSLGKGKIIILGSLEYFNALMLKKDNTRKLLQNMVLWGSLKKTAKIQLWVQSEALQQFFKEQHFSIVSNGGNKIDPSTNILFLTRDVVDSVNMKGIEMFVRRGGTLIFGSPFTEMLKENPQEYPSLHLNDLFLKAGVFHNFNAFDYQIKNNTLNEGFPYYLHINTILKKLSGNYHYNDRMEREIVISTISLAVYFGDTSLVNEIKKVLGFHEGSPVIPTPENPVYKDSVRYYLKYQLQKLLLAKQLEKQPNPNYVAPAGKIFPGEVSSTAPRVSEKITVPVRTGTQGLWEPTSIYNLWHSTGLYVPAGEKVIVSFDHNYIGQHLKIQVGAHNDHLLHMDYFMREPYNLTSTFEITKDTTEVYSAYGGILYLTIPDTCHLKMVTLNVSGAVKYPYFKLGVTQPGDWKNVIRNLAAPWAELATDKIILTVPSYRIKSLDDPEKLMRFWDEVMDADATLATIPVVRTHPERIIIDKQVAYAYLFTNSEKIVAPDDDGCRDILDETYMRSRGSWGHFHELGHRHQFQAIDFTGLGEVTVNLYTMYVFDKVLGKGIYNHEEISNKEAVIKKIKKYMAEGADFKKWSDDPFLALCMYIEIIEGFGWRPIELVYKEYRALPKDNYPSTDEEKRDYWFKTLCMATQKNLSAFFDKWGIPVSDQAKKEVSGFLPWLPDELL